jgi:tetratricopeptide (TPR) repeat protein
MSGTGEKGGALPEIRKLWDFQDPAATEARFREVLPAARASGDRAYLAELHSQIGRTLGLRQRFDEADRCIDEAEALLAGGAGAGGAGGEGMARARVLCLLERGRVRNSSLRKPEALPLFLRAWDEARAAGLGGLAVDAAHMAAAAETPERSLEWNERAIAYAEGSEDPEARQWLGSLCNNTGWDHHRAGRFDRALVLFERALAFREERKQPRDVVVARWCVARCLRSLGRTAEALGIQEALRAAAEEAGKPDGFVCEELGECLRVLDRGDEARPWFGKAWDLLSKDPWLSRDEPGRLERLKRLGAGAAE